MKQQLTIMVIAFALMPLVSLATTLSNGLVAHYKFDGNANDSSGNGNNAVVHGATLSEDRFGNSNGAFLFSGSAWIETKDSTTLQSVTNAMTCSAWIRWTADDGNWIPILCKGVSNRQFGFEIDRNAVGDRLFINDSFGTGSGKAVYLQLKRNTFPANEWLHIVATYDGILLHGYVNGKCIGCIQVNDSFAANKSPLYIGKDRPSSTEYFNGLIDDVRIYNRALAPSEVCAIYQMESIQSSVGK